MGYSKISKVLFVVIVNTFCVNAQKVMPFLGIGQNINSSFERSGYFNLSSGIQYDLNTYSKPEVELRFFFGRLQDNTTYDAANPFLAIKDVFTTFQAFNWSVTPNFSFPLDEDRHWYLAVKPKYNYANIKASDVILVYEGGKTLRSEVFRTSVSRSFGLNVGVVGKVWSDSFDAISLSLFVDNANFSKVIKRTSDMDVDTKYNLGFEVTYYFSFKKKN